MAKKTLSEQAEEIKKIAEESGIQSNYFFITTFNRYQVQLNMLTELEKSIKEEGMIVKKEYVKGRKNLYSSPAVADYNKTTDSANKTVACLMKIIRTFNVGETTKDEDPIWGAINGNDEDDDYEEQ